MIDSADDSEMDSERHQRTFVFRPTTEHIETRKNFFAFAAKINLIDGKLRVSISYTRTYPFGPLRRGRPYKIGNRLVLAKEAELGLEPRRHRHRNLI